MSQIAFSQGRSTTVPDETSGSHNNYTVKRFSQDSSLFELTVVSGPLVGSKTVVETMSPSLAYFNILSK